LVVLVLLIQEVAAALVRLRQEEAAQAALA
jgi:hypothetical protein